MNILFGTEVSGHTSKSLRLEWLGCIFGVRS